MSTKQTLGNFLRDVLGAKGPLELYHSGGRISLGLHELDAYVQEKGQGERDSVGLHWYPGTDPMGGLLDGHIGVYLNCAWSNAKEVTSVQLLHNVRRGAWVLSVPELYARVTPE